MWNKQNTGDEILLDVGKSSAVYCIEKQNNKIKNNYETFLMMLMFPFSSEECNSIVEKECISKEVISFQIEFWEKLNLFFFAFFEGCLILSP